MNRLSVAFALAFTLLAAVCLQPAFAAEPAQVVDTSIGPVLADPEGRTLYTFDKDTAGQSNCNGTCEENWPPHYATDDDQPEGDWTLVTRDDGQKQWAYKGRPVYTWINDQQRGDVTGEGQNNTWRALKP